jgi:hypothetical protein
MGGGYMFNIGPTAPTTEYFKHIVTREGDD